MTVNIPDTFNIKSCLHYSHLIWGNKLRQSTPPLLPNTHNTQWSLTVAGDLHVYTYFKPFLQFDFLWTFLMCLNGCLEICWLKGHWGFTCVMSLSAPHLALDVLSRSKAGLSVMFCFSDEPVLTKPTWTNLNHYAFSVHLLLIAIFYLLWYCFFCCFFFSFHL